MTETHTGAWTRTSRVIKARPDEIYEAFMNPAALADWLPPGEMTGEIHEFDARVGGGYRMSVMYQGACFGRITALDDLQPFLDEPIRYCAPKEVTIGQMIRVVVRHLETHPDRLHENFTRMAMLALKITWPCPSR